MTIAHLPSSILASSVLEGISPREWFKRDRPRRLIVKPDPAHEKYLQIPVFYRLSGEGKVDGRYVNLYKLKTANSEMELKRHLHWLVQHRRGYQPGDLFVTPVGNYRITDTLGVEEA